MKYLHLPCEDVEGVSTVRIYNDGYASFHHSPDDEYTVQDLKLVIAEIEFEQDNASNPSLDASGAIYGEDWYDDVDEYDELN